MWTASEPASVRDVGARRSWVVSDVMRGIALHGRPVAMTQRVVLVTGAAGGIGTAIVNRFRRDGEIVVGLDLANSDIDFDITQAASVDAAVSRIIAEHGRIDVLCNNAGIAAVGDVVDASPQDWTATFAVNVFGLAAMSRSVLPHMRALQSGVIINTCSVAASVGLVQRAVYSASKGAVLALTKAMAADELLHGIRVNCVSPGTVWSPWVERVVANTPDPSATVESMRKRQPLGRMVAVDEVADAVAYLAAPSTFTTGSDFLLDGGITGVRIVPN
jgi:2-keto-3-deoxy-L-fuconate dehydrogenase